MAVRSEQKDARARTSQQALRFDADQCAIVKAQSSKDPIGARRDASVTPTPDPSGI